MEQQIGTIVSSSTTVGYCQFTPLVRQGSTIYYREGTKKIACRITYLYSSPYKGILGHISFLDQLNRPPKVGTQLFMDGTTKTEAGVYIEIGKDNWEQPVYLRLNAIFRNLLIAGKTTSGKTHAAIVIAEELVRLKVPHIIFDTQDEFVGLKEKFPGDVVATAKFREVIAAVKARKTILVRMMGMAEADKAEVVADIVSELRSLKEVSYKRNPKTIPPCLITLDEAELFAPASYSNVISSKCRRILEGLVKRGVKFGLGTILLSQRPPMLDFDLRSQSNSLLCFLLDDPGSLKIVKMLSYVTRYDGNVIRTLQQGECLAIGAIVPKPVKAKVRDITIRRTKSQNFEQLLELQVDVPEPEKPVVPVPTDEVETLDGEVVERETGIVRALREERRRVYGPYPHR
mgnify:CR=1 FL=1